jgi:hypothetical protein
MLGTSCGARAVVAVCDRGTLCVETQRIRTPELSIFVTKIMILVANSSGRSPYAATSRSAVSGEQRVFWPGACPASTRPSGPH